MSGCAICCEPKCKMHYGAASCDGCKAFFRRTVRLGLRYRCRKEGKCSVEFDLRNACRCCRYNKCLSVGMSESAVQNVRDNIRKEPSSGSVSSSTSDDDPPTWSPPDGDRFAITNQLADFDLFRRLVAADQTIYSSTEFAVYIRANYRSFIRGLLKNKEMHCRRFCDELKAIDKATSSSIDQQGFRLSSFNRSYLLTKTPLMELVGFFRNHTGFSKLTLPDKVMMFRSHAPECVLYGDCVRSLPYHDFVVLSNGTDVLPRGYLQPTGASTKSLTDLILNELIEPLRRLQLDGIEICCMKALSFWNPMFCSSASKSVASHLQLLFLLTLEKYVNDKRETVAGRFGSILMLQRTFQDVGRQLRECIQLAELFDFVEKDEFISDCFREPTGPPDGVLAKLFSVIDDGQMMVLSTLSPTGTCPSTVVDPQTSYYVGGISTNGSVN